METYCTTTQCGRNTPHYGRITRRHVAMGILVEKYSTRNGRATRRRPEKATQSPPPPYPANPLMPLEAATPKNKPGHSTPSSICKKVRTKCRSPSHKRFQVGCSSPFMRLNARLKALRAWRKQCLPGRCDPDVLHPRIVRMRASIV